MSRTVPLSQTGDHKRDSPAYLREKKPPILSDRGLDLQRKSQAVSRAPVSGALLPLQEGQGELRACVGLGEHGGSGLGENLGPRQVRRLFRKIGIADGAVGGRDVLERHAKTADGRANRE